MNRGNQPAFKHKDRPDAATQGHAGGKPSGPPKFAGSRPAPPHQQQQPKVVVHAEQKPAAKVDLGEAAELLCGGDLLGVPWWDLEARFAQAAGSGAKKDQKGKKKSKKPQPAPSSGGATSSQAASPDIKLGEAVLSAAIALFEERRAKKKTQDAKWTEKVLEKGKAPTAPYPLSNTPR
jgi:hypothetical protein